MVKRLIIVALLVIIVHLYRRIEHLEEIHRVVLLSRDHKGMMVGRASRARQREGADGT